MRSIALLLGASLACASWAREQTALTLLATIDLPGVEGRIDHLAFDPATRRLFVAALGNGSMEIVDLRTSTRVRSVGGFHEPQGVAFVPAMQVAAVASGEGGDLTLVSTDGQVVRKVRVGDDADNVRWDGEGGRLYVGFGDGALAAIDPKAAAVVGTVRLPAHPESFQLEASGPRIFVNVPGAGQLVIVDRRTMTVAASWPVAAARANYPMALDETGHRLFLGCRQPARVLVYDTSTGRHTATFETVGDADDVFFDAVRQRIYVSGGDGFVDVIDAGSGNGYTRLARVPTAAGARTSLWVPAAGGLVVAVPRRDGHGAQLRVFAVA